MIFLLLFIPTLAIGAEIGWERCTDKTVKCYIHVKCAATPGDGEKLKPLKDADRASSIACKTGYQITHLTEDMLLLQMHVEGKMKETDQELSMYYGNSLMIGCKKIENIGYEVIGEKDMKRTHHYALFEDRTVFGEDHSTCAVQIERMSKFQSAKSLADVTRFPPGDGKLKLRYFGPDGQPVIIENEEPGTTSLAMNVPTTYQCDPYYSFKDGQPMDGFHVLSMTGRDRKVLDCTNYEKFAYNLRMNKDGVSEDIWGLECTDTHEYRVIKEEPTTITAVTTVAGTSVNIAPVVVEPLPSLSNVEFYCTLPIDRICVNPFPTCATCPKYTPGTDALEAKLECPGGKWLIDGAYRQLKTNDKVVCKEDEIQNTAAFYMVLETGDSTDEVLLNAALNVSCFTNYDCAIASELDYSDCKKGDDCGVLEYTKGVMKCEDPAKYRLSVSYAHTNATPTALQYTCDGATGKWKSDGTTLEKGARVRCFGDDPRAEEQKSEAGFTQAHVDMAIVGVILITLLIFGILILLVLCVRRKLNGARIDKKKWMKMKLPERIKHAKLTFQKVTNASPDSAVRIIHGFETLEMLLDTNTEEPEVWEEVYPFLHRVLGTLDSIDYKLSDLYLRFLYIKAKTIIDLNGWKARTPITKSNPGGLIRCVAIEFLACCVFARDDEDVTMLIEDGYRKLNFNAVEQYPHCGQLWPLVVALDNDYCNPSDPAKGDIRLDLETFMDTLYKMSKKPLRGLANDDIIPHFGSVADQAVAALGRLPHPAWNYRLVQEYFQKTSDPAAIKFLTGIGHTINYDVASRIIIPTFHFAHDSAKAKEKKPGFVAFHEMARKIAPVDVWSALTDEIIKIMIYFNHALDAKKLQNLIMPEVQQPSEYYTELRTTQQQFRAAIEDQAAELWSWFAPKMDTEDLTVRPALTAVSHSEFVEPAPEPIQEEAMPKEFRFGRKLDAAAALNAPTHYAATAPTAAATDAPAAAADGAAQTAGEPVKP